MGELISRRIAEARAWLEAVHEARPASDAIGRLARLHITGSGRDAVEAQECLRALLLALESDPEEDEEDADSDSEADDETGEDDEDDYDD